MDTDRALGPGIDHAERTELMYHRHGQLAGTTRCLCSRVRAEARRDERQRDEASPPARAAPRSSLRDGQAQSITLLRDAFREDIATAEGSQAGLMSGSLNEINFSDAEISCRHQYEVIERMLAEAS